MMRDFSPGLAMRRNWGTIAKCPHCDKINIVMTHKNQITCRGEKCQRAQNRLMEQKRAGK